MRFFTGVTGYFSWKRFFFVFVSFVSICSPIVLICLRMITGEDFLSYFKILTPGFLAAYAYGKSVDIKANPPGAGQ